MPQNQTEKETNYSTAQSNTRPREAGLRNDVLLRSSSIIATPAAQNQSAERHENTSATETLSFTLVPYITNNFTLLLFKVFHCFTCMSFKACVLILKKKAFIHLLLRHMCCSYLCIQEKYECWQHGLRRR